MHQTRRFRMFGPRVLSWGLSALMACGVFGASSAWCAAPAESSSSEGRKAYEAICRHCHEAGVGPELRGRKLQPIYVNLFVRRGMRAMPSFPRSFIDDATLLQLGEFIQRSAAPPVPLSAKPVAGVNR